MMDDPEPETASATFRLDAYEMELTDIATADVNALQTLSIALQWPHRAEDWVMLRALGRGYAMRDTIGRLLGTAMWFTYGGAFMTIGMVMISPRLQMLGGGRWLMKHVIAQAGHCAIGLNATQEAWRLYTSLSFTPETKVYQCNGIVAAPASQALPPRTKLRAATRDDLAAIIALDTRAFGAGRAELLSYLMASSRGSVLLRHGQVEAFAFCRPFGRGHLIGPIVAADDDDAIAVIRPHVVEHEGQFLRVDTRQSSGSFAAFLSRCGMPLVDTVTTMSLGRRWIPRERQTGDMITYGLASQALG